MRLIETLLKGLKMANNMTLKLGNKTIGRRGLVCTMCRISLAGKQVHKITPPADSEFVGFTAKITVCSVCKDNA